jgi:hypothetical protein
LDGDQGSSQACDLERLCKGEAISLAKIAILVLKASSNVLEAKECRSKNGMEGAGSLDVKESRMKLANCFCKGEGGRSAIPVMMSRKFVRAHDMLRKLLSTSSIKKCSSRPLSVVIARSL